ncbi:putative inorganic phosphate cotransporter isoform X2 [Parasteatoda tepidariorum]|uniref:putative inorganic phosphate cotransporter isoform X1 n=1 Tax=Parasteatoda tepidariorum TaxID=114398 RepID=UPI001C71C99A|nr:putative inorganic phosphate cotransporter [Parasteatoda tepidariorum]
MIPARLVLTLLGFFGYINIYAMRVNLSVAMVAMVRIPRSDNRTNETKITCPELILSRNTTTQEDEFLPDGEFEWNSNMQGQVVGAYFYGYLLSQIPGGMIAEKYGAKWVYGLGVLFCAIATLLTPTAARLDVWALIFARAVVGFSGGIAYPSMNVLVSRWAPKMERSRISTAMYTGGLIGTLITNVFTGILSESSFLGGWPSIFYICGTFGCCWFIFWAVLAYDTPDVHPRISKEELAYIQDNLDKSRSDDVKTPWKSIWTSVPFWALIIAHFGQNWVFYNFLTMMPTYLSNVLHFDLKDNGILSGLPFLMMSLFAFPASVVADFLRAGGYLQITTIRKLITGIGFFGPGLCAVAIGLIGCHPIIIIILFSLSYALNGLVYSGFMVNHVDMSPRFAGTLFGITNAIATLPGFMAPAFDGYILKSGQTLGNWEFVFLSSAAMHFVTGFIYMLFGSADLQPWNDPESDDAESKKEMKCIEDISHKLKQ